MRSWLAIVGVLGLTVVVVQAADDPAVKEIITLSDAYNEATKTQDKKFFEDTLSDQLVVIGKNGTKSDKKRYIELSLDPKVKYESLSCSEREVRVFGDTAIETGKVVAVGKSDAKAF